MTEIKRGCCSYCSPPLTLFIFFLPFPFTQFCYSSSLFSFSSCASSLLSHLSKLVASPLSGQISPPCPIAVIAPLHSPPAPSLLAHTTTLFLGLLPFITDTIIKETKASYSSDVLLRQMCFITSYSVSLLLKCHLNFPTCSQDKWKDSEGDLW